jgi:DNA-binding response OmpR family regulator
MPEVRGDELVRQIRQKCPYVDVLLVTGALPEEKLRVENCPILKKPFLPNSLAEAVKAILSSQIH